MKLTTSQFSADLSIIIVAYNVKDLVHECLLKVQNSQDNLNKETIFVDNGSTDGTVELIKEKFPEVKLIESPENLGFIKANNLGYQSAQGKYILMLNSDAFVGPNTLQTITDFMEQTPKCGVLGCRAVNGEGQLQPTARNFPTPWRIFLTKMGLTGKLPFFKDINDLKTSHDVIRECDWVTGCCLLIRKEIVDDLAFFLRPQFYMYNDDNDLCLRVKRKGWKVIFHPETITHLVGINNDKIAKDNQDTSRLSRLNIESEYIYFRHNYNILWVIYHFSMIALFDFIQILKRYLLMKKKICVKEKIAHIKMAYHLLRETQYGKTALKKH